MNKIEIVEIRFFADLNHFLMKSGDANPISAEIQIGQNIKDLIESFGIPHTEVFLIMVNNNPADFNYKLKKDDRISVYPKFFNFNIEEISPIQDYHFEEYKFILDVHLGKLTKNLRMLGFDCKYENNYDDLQIIKIGVEENRIILTRDIGILKFTKVRYGYLIKSQNPDEQTQEVLLRYNLHKRINPFSRCMECNALISKVEKKKVIDKLEPKTKLYFEEFTQCTNCQRIYWGGSHLEKMNLLIEKLVGEC